LCASSKSKDLPSSLFNQNHPSHSISFSNMHSCLPFFLSDRTFPCLPLCVSCTLSLGKVLNLSPYFLLSEWIHGFNLAMELVPYCNSGW
jgi:hypothetical protein